jgi:hypothetical protein
MDTYDAIEALEGSDDAAVQLLVSAARTTADLWNDPPMSGYQREQVEEVFPELAEALHELLGGGPNR